jgi:hypothetical protein
MVGNVSNAAQEFCQGYAKFLKTNAEAIAGIETVINHFLPELSNAPEVVAAVAPDY